jgi:hypothetical protein
VSTPREPLGLPQLAVTCALALVATIYVTGILLTATTLGLGFDFRFQYYDGATAIVNGDPLYTYPDDPALEVGKAYVYPPPLAAVLTPVTVLSRDLATMVAIVGSLAAVLGSLALVGVRDVRCYAAVVLTAPVWNVLETANVTVLLTLALALAWRYRSTVWPLALALGLAISMKMFLWPMTVWVVATRRYGAAVRLALVAIASLLAAWAAAGFQGVRAYPDVIARLAEIHASQSYSIVGMAAALGVGSIGGHAALLLVGGALLVACVALAQRGDDGRAFTLAVAATLALTPILWQHYLCLLLVPLAVARPRFSPLWCLPAVRWIAPRGGHGDGIEPFRPALVATVLVVAIVTPLPALRRRLQEAVA